MSLALPDVNVWLALASEEHSHWAAAMDWWEGQDESIVFCRFTQMGLLRLLTTAAAMDGKPLTMKRAWKVYDGFFSDARVEFQAEPPAMEGVFRKHSSAAQASPKLWADAYLLAFAAEAGAMLITFDEALARKGGHLALHLR